MEQTTHQGSNAMSNHNRGASIKACNWSLQMISYDENGEPLVQTLKKTSLKKYSANKIGFTISVCW